MKKKFITPPYLEPVSNPKFIREEYQHGVGRVAVFEDMEVVTDPHPNYAGPCSRLIDKIFFQPKINKNNLKQYVA